MKMERCSDILKADLLIENRLICEIKGVRALVDEHIAQLLGYLRASRIEHGLLINFGGPRLEIKKYIVTKATSRTRMRSS